MTPHLANRPGMLFVTMQPGSGLSPDQFHEWYNNEHGPTRLRLASIFSNGLRYRATDSAEPSFLAVYDVTSLPLLATPAYTSLRENRSAREAETIGQVDVKRTFLELLSSRQSPSFVAPERRPLPEAESESATVLVSVELMLRQESYEDKAAEAEVRRWYEEEHLEMLSKVPGWLRSRVFRPALPGGGPADGPARLVALHELARTNGLGGPEQQAASATPWRAEIMSKWVVSPLRIRSYELFYVFGPGPRDLLHLSRLPASKSFSNTANSSSNPYLVTEAGESAAISSCVATADGLALYYRLEGNPSPVAPVVAFSNSLLTSLHMWDELVAQLAAQRPDLRILRYDTRGRRPFGSQASAAVPATLEMLAADLAALLAALRIPKLHALVGVSMGGATTLAFALRHPDLVSRFVACDFNAASSPANTTAWKERIAVAQSPAAAETGMQRLARATVERWFHPATLSEKPALASAMVDMVAANDVAGFRLSCQALWDYDLTGRLGSCRVPGLLVVGEGDGKGALVKAMERFRGLIGAEGAVELRVVPATGHLPMFEDAAAFWERVRDFI